MDLWSRIKLVVTLQQEIQLKLLVMMHNDWDRPGIRQLH